MSRQTGSTGTSDWLLSAAKQNPEGLLLLAAGAVLLMRKVGGPSLSNTNIQRQATKVARGAKDYAYDMSDRTSQTVGSVASSASEYAGQARRTVSEQSEKVFHQAQSSVQGTIDRVLRDQPLAVAFAGIAAGAAVAAAFPATDFEKEAFGPIGEQVSGAAGRVAEQLKEAAGRAGESLKSAVEERGLNASGLKEVASEVAGAFGSSMAGDAGKSSDKSGQPRSGNRDHQGKL